MKPKVIDYYLGYAFADTVRSVVRSPSYLGFDDSTFPDFFGFRTNEFFEKAAKPNKHTILHIFIYEINYFGYEYMLRKNSAEECVEQCHALISAANIPIPAWLNENQVMRHQGRLGDLVQQACQVVTDATFQLLFSDRTFLFEFNCKVAASVAMLQKGEHPAVIANGEIRRETYFPVWLKEAIFHRDKGRCQLCGCDLTNILVPTEQRHIDHMVPLKAHGTNDPTNLQLVCEKCNKSKGASVVATQHLSYTFW